LRRDPAPIRHPFAVSVCLDPGEARSVLRVPDERILTQVKPRMPSLRNVDRQLFKGMTMTLPQR
jgi:hypothetical protein